MTSVVEIPLWDVRDMAAALVPHASKDDVTPTLTYIAVQGNFAYSTDRYTVGRYDLTNVLKSEPNDEAFFIPARALSAVRMLGPATLPGFNLQEYVVRFSVSSRDEKTRMIHVQVVWKSESDRIPDEVHWMRTWFIPANKLIMPRVPRLFDEFTQGDRSRLTLGGDHLGKFTGYSKYKRSAMRVTLPAGEKNAPVLVEIGMRFKGLIMPYTVIDSATFGVDLAAQNAEKKKEVGDGTAG